MTPPPFPEECKKCSERPRSLADQSIIRTSSSVHAGLHAHYREQYEEERTCMGDAGLNVKSRVGGAVGVQLAQYPFERTCCGKEGEERRVLPV